MATRPQCPGSCCHWGRHQCGKLQLCSVCKWGRDRPPRHPRNALFHPHAYTEEKRTPDSNMLNILHVSQASQFHIPEKLHTSEQICCKFLNLQFLVSLSFLLFVCLNCFVVLLSLFGKVICHETDIKTFFFLSLKSLTIFKKQPWLQEKPFKSHITKMVIAGWDFLASCWMCSFENIVYLHQSTMQKGHKH